MSIKTVHWFLMSMLILWLSACSKEKPVVIKPGSFSEDWPTAIRGALTKNKRCAIDSVNGKNAHQRNLSVKSGETLALSGWVFSERDGAPAKVYVQLVGPALTYTAMTQTRVARPDVTQAFTLNPAWITGFKLEATQHAEPNVYELQVLQAGPETVAQCDSGITVTIE